MSPRHEPGTAHLYAQEGPHDEAYLLSDRRALLDIRAAIDAALSSPDGAGRAEVFAADGEGYSLFLLLARDGDLESSETPYTGADDLDPRPTAVHPAALLLRRRGGPSAVQR